MPKTQKTAPVVHENRRGLLKVLGEMPDEAFGWIVAAFENIFPDGTGGFQPESKQSIAALRAATTAYYKTQK